MILFKKNNILKILNVIFLSFSSSIAFSNYQIQVSRMSNETQLNKTLKTVGIDINADEFVNQIKHNKNINALNLLKSLNYNKYFNSLLDNASKNQKGALIDVADQLNIRIKNNLLSLNDLIIYQNYLKKKITTPEFNIVNLENEKDIRTKYNIDKSDLSKIDKPRNGQSNNIIVNVSKKLEEQSFHNEKTDLAKQINVFKSQLLEESMKKRQEYINFGANIPKNGFLSLEESQELGKKFNAQFLKMQNEIYQKYKTEIKSMIDEAIKNKEIDNICSNDLIANEFSRGYYISFKNLTPKVTIGKFTITQENDNYSILTPSFTEIVNYYKDNKRPMKVDFLKKNLFLLKIEDSNLYQKIITNGKQREVIKNNLFQTNINDLAIIAMSINTDNDEGKQDLKDFMAISKRLIAYNSLVCLY